MSKESLFDMESSAYGVIPVGPARARNSDPETSHEAASRHNRSGKSKANCEIVLALVRAWPGMTSVELHGTQVDSCLERHEVSRRLSDLERKGLVRKGPEKVCEVKRTKMVTWWVKE